MQTGHVFVNDMKNPGLCMEGFKISTNHAEYYKCVEHTYPTLASSHSQLHGLASRTHDVNTSSSAVPLLDPRYGHVGNKSLGTKLRTAENGIHIRDFSSLVRRQTGELSLSSTHMLKSTDASVKYRSCLTVQISLQRCLSQTRQTDRQTEAIV